MRKKWVVFEPYILIILVALFLLSPQIIHHSALVGIDGIFHMNRFYDTAMQVKTGHYNYFQSFFGFYGSGRIVNPLYGPSFAYLNGLLLLIAKSWVNYQIISSFLILIISGFSMYRLAKKFQVKYWERIIVGILYMSSPPILGWVTGQQFTGWGAALLPILFLNAVDMLDGEVKPFKLAIALSLIFQVHTISFLIGCTGLIPFWLIGMINHQKNRITMLIDSLKSALLTVLLSASVLYGIAEVTKTNIVLLVAPYSPLKSGSTTIIPNNLGTSISVVFTLMVVGILLYSICFWRYLKLDTKVVIVTTILFLLISSQLFPWNLLGSYIPSLEYTLQMPKRIAVVSYLLAPLSIGMILRDHGPIKYRGVLKIIAILLMLLFGRRFYSSMRAGVREWNSSHVLRSTSNVTYHTKNADKIRSDFRSNNTGLILKDISKGTPDYLPSKQRWTAKQYFSQGFYAAYNRHIVNSRFNKDHRQNHFHRTVSDNQLVLTWINNRKNDKRTYLPLVKYSKTMVELNGKRLTNVSHTKIGSMIVNAKLGKNRLVMQYHPGPLFLITMLISIVSWIFVIGMSIWKYLKNKAIRS